MKSSQEREATKMSGALKILEIRVRRFLGSSIVLRNWNVAEISPFLRTFSDLITQIVTRKVTAISVGSLNTFCLLLRHTFLPASAVRLGLLRNSQSVGSRLPQARNIKGTTQLGGQSDYLHCLRFFFCFLCIKSCQQS